MLHIIYRLMEILAQYQKITLPIGILISLAICFMGYKYLNAWVACFGFILGFGGGYLVSSQMIAENIWAPLLIGVMAGVILMLLTFIALKAGIFAFAAVLVGEAVLHLSVMDRVRGLYLPGELGAKMVAAFPVVIALLLGIAAGMAALKSTRTVIIAATGITGAYRAVAYVARLLEIQIAAETQYLWIAVMVLLALLGMLMQIHTTKK